MAVKFKVSKALEGFKNNGGTTKFPDSLRDVLKFIQNDPNINTKKEVAWLLATAKVESDYSLQRWESDYLCGDAGVPYKNEPCDRAIRYYRSTDGKKNYFDLGTDKNGMAYFGRGLIQLTGKSNYKKYGDLIGVDLINDGDKAMIPKNSYNIATAYFNRKRGSENKSVYDYANEEDFPMARKRVKGSSKGWEEAKKEYDKWINVLEDSESKFKDVKLIKKKRITRGLLYSSIVVGMVGFSVGFFLLTRPNK